MASDPAVLDAAVVAKLLGDTALMAKCTDGIYFDTAPQGKTRFVLVSLQDSHTERMENGIAYEVPVYLVKAVIQDTSGLDANTAAARIDALLENNGQGGSLGTVVGYGIMTTGRIDDGWRVRYTEVDEDKDLRWQHRGGLYEIWAAPN